MDKFDEILRNKLSDFSPEAPPGVLDKIKSSVNQSASEMPSHKPTGSHNSWIYITTAIVAVVTVGALLFTFNEKEEKIEQQVVEEIATEIPVNVEQSDFAEVEILNASDENLEQSTNSKEENYLNPNVQQSVVVAHKKGVKKTRITVCGLETQINTATKGKPERNEYAETIKINDKIFKVKVDEFGTYTFKWRSLPDEKELEKEIYIVDFVEKPEVYLGEDKVVCGNETNLSAKVNQKGQWHAVSGVVFNEKDNPHTQALYMGTGTVDFIYIAENSQCKNSDTVSITFLDKPNAEAIVVENNETGVTLSAQNSSGIKYKWNVQFGDYEMISKKEIEIDWDDYNFNNVSLTVWEDETCPATSMITVFKPDMEKDIAEIKEDENTSSLVVPDVFTPNGDGLNDVFQVKAKNIIEFKGIIFSSAGYKVYEWTDCYSKSKINGGWNGLINGSNQAEPGKYMCIINAKGLDGEIYTESKIIQLFK